MWRDEASVLDIVIWARRAIAHTDGLDRQDFHTNLMAQDAVIRCLEIVGEAAGRLSAEYRDSHPEIEWSAIIGMRNRLAHEYGQIDLDHVWRAATVDCPRLVAELEKG